MRVNSEIALDDVAFPLHLLILREEDIYCSEVYPLFLFPAKPWIQTSHLFLCEQYIHRSKQSLRVCLLQGKYCSRRWKCSDMCESVLFRSSDVRESVRKDIHMNSENRVPLICRDCCGKTRQH